MSASILSKPFIDLGLEYVAKKTVDLHEITHAYHRNMDDLMQAENDDIVKASLGLNVQLLGALNYQKSNLYSPSKRPVSRQKSPGVPGRSGTASGTRNMRPQSVSLNVQTLHPLTAADRPMSPAHSSTSTNWNSSGSPVAPIPLAPLQSPITMPKKSMSAGPAGYLATPWSPSSHNIPLPQSLSNTRELTLSLGSAHILHAPEVVSSISSQAQSLYKDDLRRASPTAGRLLEPGRDISKTVADASQHVSISVMLHSDTGDHSVRLNSQPEADRTVRSVVEIALTEAQLKAELDSAFNKEMLLARAHVTEKLGEEMQRERQREDRVRSQAARETQCRDRIRLARAGKSAQMEARNDAKHQARAELMSRMESHSSSLQELKATAAMERKNKILNDREARQEALAASMREHTAHVDTVNARRAEDQKALSERRGQEHDLKVREKVALTVKLEADLIEQRAAALLAKEAQHNAFEKKLAAQSDIAARERALRDAELGFQAEQRRRLIALKRQGERKIGQVKQAREKVIAKTRLQISTDRRANLNRLLAESYKSKEGGVAEPSEVTPGPGEYYRAATAVPRGGYLASSRVEAPVSISFLPSFIRSSRFPQYPRLISLLSLIPLSFFANVAQSESWSRCVRTLC